MQIKLKLSQSIGCNFYICLLDKNAFYTLKNAQKLQTKGIKNIQIFLPVVLLVALQKWWPYKSPGGLTKMGARCKKSKGGYYLVNQGKAICKKRSLS